MTNPNRTKKGIPAGGQFDNKTTPEANVTLGQLQKRARRRKYKYEHLGPSVGQDQVIEGYEKEWSKRRESLPHLDQDFYVNARLAGACPGDVVAAHAAGIDHGLYLACVADRISHHQIMEAHSKGCLSNGYRYCHQAGVSHYETLEVAEIDSDSERMESYGACREAGVPKEAAMEAYRYVDGMATYGYHREVGLSHMHAMAEAFGDYGPGPYCPTMEAKTAEFQRFHERVENASPSQIVDGGYTGKSRTITTRDGTSAEISKYGTVILGGKTYESLYEASNATDAYVATPQQAWEDWEVETKTGKVSLETCRRSLALMETVNFAD